MTLRIWLKESVPETMKLGERNVKIDQDSGARHFELYLDPIDPSADIPALDRKHVKRLSFRDHYHTGFRPDGVYKWKGATARVELKREFKGSVYAKVQEEEVYQMIYISAPSLRTLREIYSKVRTGELKPVADWGKPPAVDQETMDVLGEDDFS